MIQTVMVFVMYLKLLDVKIKQHVIITRKLIRDPAHIPMEYEDCVDGIIIDNDLDNDGVITM